MIFEATCAGKSKLLFCGELCGIIDEPMFLPDVEAVASAERTACWTAADNVTVRASKLTFTIPAFSDDVGAELAVCS